jgi:cystathionine beta-lyase
MAGRCAARVEVVYGPAVTELDRLRSLTGLKWTRHGPDVLPAFVADMDLDPCDVVKDAMVAMIERGDLGYQTTLHEDLLSEFARWFDDEHGASLPVAELRPYAGVMTGVEAAMVAASRPGDGVAVFTPIYYPFLDSIRDAGRRIVDVPLGEGWRLDADRLADTIDADTRVVLMSQPHNPVGRVFDRDEIGAFADVVIEHDLLVVSDEIWADLAHPPHRHLPLVVADPRLRDHTVTLGSASKSFNISGLRCAVGHVGHPGLRAALDALPTHLPGGPSTLGLAATVAAWRHGRDWLADTRALLTANRDHLAERLAAEAPAIRFDPPEATYLAWLDMAACGLGDDPAAVVLEHGGVALSSGPPFGAPDRGFARLNFATTPDILDQLIDRVVTALAGGPVA